MNVLNDSCQKGRIYSPAFHLSLDMTSNKMLKVRHYENLLSIRIFEHWKVPLREVVQFLVLVAFVKRNISARNGFGTEDIVLSQGDG